MHRKTRQSSMFLAVAATAAFMVSTALAQTASRPAAGADVGLEEIVVTARQRSVRPSPASVMNTKRRSRRPRNSASAGPYHAVEQFNILRSDVKIADTCGGRSWGNI
jgi:hypothetical protein